MGQVRHGSATTTHAVRAAIQRSQASIAELSRELGINPKTVAKWRKRETVEDRKTGPREPRSTVLSEEEEANGEALAAKPLVDQETGDAPDVLVVHGLQNARRVEPWEGAAFVDLNPAHGVAVMDGNKPRHMPGFEDPLHGLSIAVAHGGVHLRLGAAPQHAPATTAAAFLAHDGGKIRPGRGPHIKRHRRIPLSFPRIRSQ